MSEPCECAACDGRGRVREGELEDESLAHDIAWEPLSPEELARELDGAAHGLRTQGERSICGRYLVALLPSTHPLHSDRWELYGSGPRGGWAIKTCWPTRGGARAEAMRQSALGSAS